MLRKTDELKDRVEARRHELMAKLDELKADTRREAADTRDKIKGWLDELTEYTKDGWDKLTDSAADKINRWLDKKN